MIGSRSNQAGMEPPRGLAASVRGLNLTFPCGLDKRRKTDYRYAVPSTPYAVVIGLDGTVAWQGHPLSRAFAARVEMALAELPDPFEFVTEDQAEAVKPLAEASANGDYSAAIEGLVALLENDDTDDDVRDDAMALLELVADVAETAYQEIEDLDGMQFYFESDALMASRAWLREVEVYRERLDELLADRDEETYAEGKQAGERYHRGLDHLRAGEIDKAKAEFAAVVEEYAATSYGELALNKLSQLK